MQTSFRFCNFGITLRLGLQGCRQVYRFRLPSCHRSFCNLAISFIKKASLLPESHAQAQCFSSRSRKSVTTRSLSYMLYIGQYKCLICVELSLGIRFNCRFCLLKQPTLTRCSNAQKIYVQKATLYSHHSSSAASSAASMARSCTYSILL